MIYSGRKLFYASGLIAIYFAIRAYFWNWGMRDLRVATGHTEEDVLTECILTGYFSTQEIVLIGTLCLILFVEYLAYKEDALHILRFENREKYILRNIANVTVTCILFCSLRVSIGASSLWIEFGNKYILTKEIMAFVLWYTVITSLYSMHCSMVYMILKDFVKRKGVALVIFMVAQLVLYYIYTEQWLFFLLQKEVVWLPFCDIDAPGAVYAMLIDSSEYYLVTCRQACITALTAIAWIVTWKRKDVITIEK